MARKEAIVFIIDLGFKQENEFGKLKNAQTIAKQFLMNKILFDKQSQVGMVAIGCQATNNALNDAEDGQYLGAYLLSEIELPTLEFVQALDLEQVDRGNESVLVEGFIIALDMLLRKVGTKRFRKKIVFMIDAMTAFEDEGDIRFIAEQLENNAVALDVVVMDSDKSNFIQQEHMRMFNSITGLVGGRVTTCAQMLDELEGCRSRSIMQVSKFRGNLEISEKIQIPIWVYGKVQSESLPTLTKESKASYDASAGGEVKMDRVYLTEEKHPVSPSSRIKSFRYGDEYIPFSMADELTLKLSTEKSCQLLAFMPKSKLPYTHVVSSTDVAIASPDHPDAALAVSALVRGMDAEHCVGIARMVYRANSPPKIVAFLPNVNENPDATTTDQLDSFYVLHLPFHEDLRHFEFHSLQTTSRSTQQTTIAEDLVDTFTTDTYDMKSTYNPTLQRFYKSVQHRALHPKDPIPEISPTITNRLLPTSTLLEKAQPILTKFQQAFPLQPVLKVTKSTTKSFWTDIDTIKEETSTSNSNPEINSNQDQDDNPITTFNQAIATNDLQNISSAMNQFQIEIMSLIRCGKPFITKAIRCIRHMRYRYLELHESHRYNAFLHRIYQKYPPNSLQYSDFWKTMKALNLSLLSKEEDHILQVSREASNSFLHAI